MNLIDQEGVYRGVIVDGGLSESSGGFPQEVLSLKSSEVYDPDTDSWLPADGANNEIMYYGVLIDSKDKETLNCKQLKKVTGWDGSSFKTLSEMDLTNMPIQFRVEERTYNDNTSLQVTWIDTTDAAPYRTVQKLDANGVKALDQKYASVLAATKSAAKPVSAAPAKAKAKPKPPAKPTVPKTKPKAPVGKCTADEAYNACYSLKRDDVTDDALNELWLTTVAGVNDDENKITPEQWFQIKETILKQISKV
jgi:hypothetical protein